MKFHCFYREQNRAYAGQLTAPAVPLPSPHVCSKLSFQTHKTPSCAMVPGAVLYNRTSTRHRDHILHDSVDCHSSPQQPALPCPFLCASPRVHLWLIENPPRNAEPRPASVFHRCTPAGYSSHQGVTCFALDDKIPWNRILLSHSWTLLPSIRWLKLGDTWPGVLLSRHPLSTSWSLCSPCSVHNVP